MANELDSMFEQFAKKTEAEAKNGKKTTFTRDLEEIKWTGLEQGVPKVIRVVGAPFDSNVDDYTARTVTIARIIGDDGKKFRVIRPSFSEDPNYILNKIISRVKQAKWVNQEKTFPVKEKCPEIYNIIEKNGLAKTDPSFMYDKGWQGKEVLIMNVIDREQMDWHRQNKHTMLLAKSVNVDSMGNEWADEGISSYATTTGFSQLFKYYKSWENYDIAITKTGNKEHSFIIDNATKNPEKVEGPASQYISMEDHLTDEEKSWERYDLQKLFRKTTATKIYNRLKGTISRIDTALGTHFLEELEEEVEKEKVLFEKLYGTTEGEETPTTPEVKVVESTATVAPTRSRNIPSATSKELWEQLPYGSSLTDEMKKHITNVEKNGDTYNITWDTPTDELASCPDCNAVAPLECTKCPCCGLDFT